MTDTTVQDVPAVERTVRLAATGDEAAFTRLVEQHHAAMAKVAYVIVGDVDLARDAVQAAWAIGAAGRHRRWDAYDGVAAAGAISAAA